MITFSRWKTFTIIALCVLAIIYAAPNLAGKETRAWLETLPSWMPSKTVNLGLDLQGGSHLLLEVDVDAVIRERAEGLVQSIRPALREAKIGYTRISGIPGGIRINLREGQDPDAVRKVLRGADSGLEVVVSNDNDVVEGRLSDDALRQIRDQTIEQSIEIVRRRVDETGTREPVIQRQGEDRIIVQLPGLDDPERVKDLLGKTAQLAFHLVDTGRGTVSGGTRRLPMVDSPGQELTVERRPIITGDMLTNAQPSFQQGMPVVSFSLNGIGARRFCDVTREHTGEPFAIVLDREIISAPRINEPICGGSAVITGQFSVQETTDLSLLLRAGALPAPLKVLEERTVGPSLGADSVEAGKIASLYAMIFIIIMIIAIYGLFGVFSSVALLLNIAMIFALLSALQATLTLPGIAGIVLTLGMAVDANVLIFERIKEELRNGRTVIAAIDAGYREAMSSIIDANVTTLISAIILMSFGTGPIKGFAVTLSIGVITSLFSAIMVTRLMVVIWLKMKQPRTIPV